MEEKRWKVADELVVSLHVHVGNDAGTVARVAETLSRIMAGFAGDGIETHMVVGRNEVYEVEYGTGES